jgi:signal transduction histidine kinase
LSGDVVSRWTGHLRGLRFSTAVIAVYAIASLVGALIAFSSSDRGFFIALGGAALVSGVAVVVLLVLRRFITGGHDVDAVVFFSIALGVGVVRGVAMMVVGAQWELIGPTTALAQIINSGISAVVWLFLAGLVFAGRERYRRSYQSLLVQGAAHVEGASYVDADWDRNPAIVQMRANVGGRIAEAQTSPTPAALMRTADAIRTEIEQNLRPLSHRLWFGSFDEYPHVRLPQLLRDSVAAFQMPIVAIGAAWLIGGLIGGPMLFGLTRGALAAVISTACLLALLVVFTSLARRYPSLALGTVYLLVAGTVPLVAADVGLRFMGFDSDFSVANGLIILLPLALIAMMVMGLTISMASSDRSVVLSVAQRHATTSSTGSANALEASSYLHNTVQSELTGVALQLTHAARSGNPLLSRAAVSRAQEIFERSLTQEFRDHRDSAAVRIERVAKAWQGICDVELAVDPVVVTDPRAAVAIQAVEELITNAVRHSGATRITVALTATPDGLSITCWVNRQWGVGAQAGLGTRWLATVSPRGVESTQADGGTSLHLTIT